MTKRDYYEILGVDRGADGNGIRNAYRKKAMQYHPDRNAGDHKAEASFKEVGEAYEALKNPEKRAAYDRHGHAAFEAGSGGGGGGFSGANFSDIFDEMFGDVMGRGRSGKTQRQRRNRGSDLRYDLRLTLEDCYYGGVRRIDITAPLTCSDCNGGGAAKGAQMTTCSQCKGRGSIHVQQGFFTLEQTCERCQGQGRVLDHPCTGCRGSGQRQGRRTVDVEIPAGIDNGNRIRMAGKGAAGVQGGSPGDLYIFTSMADHDVFEREGNMLLCKIPLPATTAMLGGHFLVPSIEGGQTRLKIPHGTQNGQYFKIRHKGMPRLRGGGARGDLIIEVEIEIPKNLSREQTKWAEQFDQSLKINKQLPKTQNFENRVKKFKK